MRKAKVYHNNHAAGQLWEDEQGFHFQYSSDYLSKKGAEPVSLTLPLQESEYQNEVLFPFFDGLIPEGWLLNVVEKNWKINQRDRFGVLLATGKDCIGNVSVLADE